MTLRFLDSISMTSFGWKRKQSNLSQQASKAEFSSEDDDAESNEIDWLTSAKRQRGGALEDAAAKTERLKSDGVTLAESGRFWAAIRIWDEALTLSPNDASIHEMKTQVSDFCYLPLSLAANLLFRLFWSSVRTLRPSALAKRPYNAIQLGQ